MTPNNEELTSWKAIADYLVINVRTAQRWERERGLPVRRSSGEKGRVIATTEELDRWKSSNTSKQGWWSNLRALRIYGAAMTMALLIVAAIGIGSYVRSHAAGPPANLQVEDRDIVSRDARNVPLWRFALPEAPQSPETLRRTWFGHLKPKSNYDTLFSFQPARMANAQLLCISEKGQLRWRVTPGRTVADARLEYPPLYVINGFRVLAGPGAVATRIVVSSNHAWSYPAQVSVLDADGKMLGEYWHSGHLTAMDVGNFSNARETDVVLGGVDNGRQRATLVLLDPNNLHGASQEEQKCPYQFRDFAPGTEKAVVWFERSCVNQASEQFNYATEVNLIPQGVQVIVRETHDGRAYVVYLLDKHLNVIYVEPSDGFRAVHRELERSRTLDHSLNDQELAQLRSVRVFRRK